ncbi:MAG: phage tail protein [Ahrensia sp.]|nr:phage tail protein [Ahrensia sp.]
MQALIPKITDAGLEALQNAQFTGVDAAISHIAFGNANQVLNGYTPSQYQTALVNEIARVPVAGGQKRLGLLRSWFRPYLMLRQHLTSTKWALCSVMVPFWPFGLTRPNH